MILLMDPFNLLNSRLHIELAFGQNRLLFPESAPLRDDSLASTHRQMGAGYSHKRQAGSKREKAGKVERIVANF